jgi:hypothetical protein
MMKAIFTLLLTTIIISLYAQEKYKDSDNETQICGNITIEDLESPPFATWYRESLAGYTVTKDEQVADAMYDTEVLIYLGTWCTDSQDWVPKFIKIWKTYGLDLSNLHLIALHNADDKYKQSPERTEVKYNIESVPTFIFLRDGKEIGRIVEYPQTTLEEDLKSIVIEIK